MKENLRLSNKESNRLTKECLQTALIFIMSEKPFEKITVSELVRRSGVSRTAFYRNYSTKEDVLNEVCNGFLDGLAQSLLHPADDGSLFLWYQEFFRFIRENASLFGLLLQARVVNTPVFSTYSLSERLTSQEDPEARYEFLAWEGAFTTIVVHWFQDGMKEEIDYMAEFCKKSLRIPTRRPFLNKNSSYL